MMRAIIAFLVAASFAPAAPVPKALKRNPDLKLIVGEWEEKPGSRTYWNFREDGSAEYIDPERPLHEFNFKLGQNEPFNEIDWSLNQGKDVYLGIYTLKEDSLKFSIGSYGAARPKSLENTRESQVTSLIRRTEMNK